MKCLETNADRQKFIEDWNAMVAGVSEFSNKYDLPTGELIFPYSVLVSLRAVSRDHLLDTFVAHGVRTRFGRFEKADVLR